MDRSDITPALVSALVAEQFPQWAGLPVHRVELDGWDNTTYRLGPTLSIRLPSADGYAVQVEKERRWLPVLRPHLSLPIPEVAGCGRPSELFPRPWSIYRWIDGASAAPGSIEDLPRFGTDLAGFLRSLQRVEATGGPVAGAHSGQRGAPLAVYDRETRGAIDELADLIDAPAALAVWEAALGSQWGPGAVWVHGDVAPSNLIVRDDRLAAVIDFGSCAVGDPACDLVPAWTFFWGDSRAAFEDGLPLDEDTWTRGRGWALWKALVTWTTALRDGDHGEVATRRFGWRLMPGQIVDLLVAEHQAPFAGHGRSRRDRQRRPNDAQGREESAVGGRRPR